MSSIEQLRALLDQRIVVIDGAMGTMIQGLDIGLSDEATWRGERFANHTHPLKGANDLLVLTQPDAIEGIHYKFLKAGADIVETNTFGGTSIALADYGLEHVVHDLNVAGAQVAVRAADRAHR
ncbi:MAG: homocysteine S-methyltransferase family protein, partial [Proteobacteria bacterium]|nr:homocysteine S-methyltransferase family protein [Pseudomonadota bacterium]